VLALDDVDLLALLLSLIELRVWVVGVLVVLLHAQEPQLLLTEVMYGLATLVPAPVFLEDRDSFFTLRLLGYLDSLGEFLVLVLFLLFLLAQELGVEGAIDALPTPFDLLDEADHGIETDLHGWSFDDQFLLGRTRIVELHEQLIDDLVALDEFRLLTTEVPRDRHLQTLRSELQVHDELIEVHEIALEA
jgi:hypothetical protein